MKLVKTSKISRDAAAPARAHATKSSPSLPAAKPIAPVNRGKADALNATLAERIAAATEELASGLAEASAAAQELTASMS